MTREFILDKMVREGFSLEAIERFKKCGLYLILC